MENVRQVYQAWLILQLGPEPMAAFLCPQPVMDIAEQVGARGPSECRV